MKANNNNKSNGSANANKANKQKDNWSSLAKTLNAQKDTFATAVRLFFDLSKSSDENAKLAKKACDYLGINANSIKSAQIPELRKSIVMQLPLYYTIPGHDTRYPAKLAKIDAKSGIDNAYIAVSDKWINALVKLAKVLADNTAYDSKELVLTDYAPVDGDYTTDDITLHPYDKNASAIEVNKQVFVDYLNRKKSISKQTKDYNAVLWAGK